MIYSYTATRVVGRLNIDIHLTPDKQLYCFIGESGVGKTVMLETMAKSLFYIHTVFRSQRADKNYSGLIFKEKINYQIKDYLLHLPDSIEINQKSIKSAEDGWGVISLNDIRNYGVPIECDRPVVFIGAKERGYLGNLQSKQFQMLGDRFERWLQVFEKSYNSMYGESTDHGQIAQWFIQRIAINPAFIPEANIHMEETIAVLEIMQRLEPNLKLVQTDSQGNKQLSLLFHEGNLLFDGVPIEKLPTGFISIIRIIQEIVSAYGAWHKDNSPLNETAGIVFIDEIEAHLHIKWQYRILSLLKEQFPCTTFYVTTYSPLVLSNLEQDEGYKLIRENNDITANPIDDMQGYFLADIVQTCFEVDPVTAPLSKQSLDRQRYARKALLALQGTVEII